MNVGGAYEREREMITKKSKKLLFKSMSLCTGIE